MLKHDKIVQWKSHMVKPGSKVVLKKWDTKYTGKTLNKKDSEELLEESRKQLAIMQDILYAHNQYSVLIIFQAMDAAGKDGAVKHIMSGFNPLGVKVASFKAPNAQELDHDYFWRHEIAMPPRGEIGIHNRSHYENVLVTKVHPEFIMAENIPKVNSVEKVDKDFWKMRYKQINKFEKTRAENGMVILKFFLHVSKKEQKKRFLERIEDPTKNWKFSLSDMKERVFWDEYQKAYGELMTETSHEHAPWFIIPADDKWYARLAIASVIRHYFDRLELSYPIVSEKQKAELQKAKAILLGENEGKKLEGKSKKKEKKEKVAKK